MLDCLVDARQNPHTSDPSAGLRIEVASYLISGIASARLPKGPLLFLDFQSPSLCFRKPLDLLFKTNPLCLLLILPLLVIFHSCLTCRRCELGLFSLFAP